MASLIGQEWAFSAFGVDIGFAGLEATYLSLDIVEQAFGLWALHIEMVLE